MNHAGLTVFGQQENHVRPQTRLAVADRVGALIAELCALQHYLVEILDVQQFEPEVRGVTPAASLIERALARFRRHTLDLGEIIATRPAGAEQLRSAVSGKCALFFRYLSKQRSRQLASILQDDFTLFTVAATQYAELRTCAAATGEQALVALADAHHTHLAPLLSHLAMLNGAPQFYPARPDSPHQPPPGGGRGRSTQPWPHAV